MRVHHALIDTGLHACTLATVKPFARSLHRGCSQVQGAPCKNETHSTVVEPLTASPPGSPGRRAWPQTPRAPRAARPAHMCPEVRHTQHPCGSVVPCAGLAAAAGLRRHGRKARLHCDTSSQSTSDRTGLLGWSGSMLLRLEQHLCAASAHILTRVQGWECSRQAPALRTPCMRMHLCWRGARPGLGPGCLAATPPAHQQVVPQRLQRQVLRTPRARLRPPPQPASGMPPCGLPRCQPVGAGRALRRCPGSQQGPKQPCPSVLGCPAPVCLAETWAPGCFLLDPSAAYFSHRNHASSASLLSHVRPGRGPARACVRAAAPRAAGPHSSALPPRAAAPLAQRARPPRRPNSELRCSSQRRGAARAAPDAPAAGVQVCLHCARIGFEMQAVSYG